MSGDDIYVTHLHWMHQYSKLRYKLSCFEQKESPKKSLFTTMITLHGVKKNTHYHDAVHQHLALGDIFPETGDISNRDTLLQLNAP